MPKGGAKKETYEFQAEIRKLLDILAHSLYTNREIFIRELVSNAADALDKVRFKHVKGEDIADPDLDFEIRIKLDKDKKLFTITDTGIGMTKDELVENIGTIARSGSAEFVKQMSKEKDDLSLIGQFGVGFYSTFMAGTKVEITTRSADPSEPAYQWSSKGEGTFELKEIKKAPRGTTIKVHLREDAEEFTEKFRIESVIKKYSNFVPFPIYIEDEQVNNVSAIWREPKSSVTEEQYNEYYKFLTNRQDEPLTKLHLSADVPIQFHSLVFVPKTNYEVLGFGRDEGGIHLFVKRVLVDPQSKDILPNYLRFVEGVLDSDDLPLNIARETLQENTVLFKIKNTLLSKLLGHFQDMAKNDAEKYNQFWKEFGRIMKEGYNDYANKEKLSDLYRFNSSKCKSADELISLQTYVDRMKDKQDSIYYLSGQSREVIEKNPVMEIFKSKDIEVLYLYDPVDEFVMSGLYDYKEKKFASADQADISSLEKIEKTEDEAKDKEKDEKEAAEPAEKEMETLARRIKDILGDRVEDVKVSKRLVDSPAVLVSSNPGMSAQMQKMMFSLNKSATIPKKVMEINPKHPLIKNFLTIYGKDPKDAYLEKTVNRLFESVLLLDGYLTEPYKMVEGVQELLAESTEMYVKK